MVSVIVPIYNTNYYLKQCVDSILHQSFKDFDIILVDDGSTDSSASICDEYITESVLIIHKKNEGLSSARNIGIDVSLSQNSEWITFVDSDDYIHEEYLRVLLEACDKDSLNIGTCLFQRTENGSIEDISIKESMSKPPEEYWLDDNVTPRIACAKVFRSSIWRGLRFPEGRIHEDEATIYKLIFGESLIGVSDNELYYYRVNPNGITGSEWSTKNLSKVDALKEQRDYFKANGYDLAYGQAERMYLYFLHDAVERLKYQQSNWSTYIKYKLKLKAEIVKYILYSSYLKLSIEDYCISSFPIITRVYLHTKRVFEKVRSIVRSKCERL